MLCLLLKSTRKKDNYPKHSWFTRHLGSILFSTLIFSTVAYALTWPTVPGETGYPIQGSFWNYFEKMLVDTGATSDGTVKQSATLGMAGGRTAILSDVNGNTGIGTGASAPYTLSVSGQALFNDNVIGATPTASGHLATKGYVDAQVVSAAGGGGYGQCYRIKTSTPSYPTCATGYTRTYASYGDHTGVGAPTSRIYFENNIGGAWFQNFGHVYLYYTYDTNTNSFLIYDDQDVILATGIFGSEPAISNTFSSKKSTYMSYTTTSPTTFTSGGGNFISDYGYAVCCK